MMRLKITLLLALSTATLCAAPPDTTTDLELKFAPLPAPAPSHWLRLGDRLAICGDSITEQRKYSRLMEDYLTMCVPQLLISVRQYGWSGERAPGFLARMTNDCLRFNPTIATTCYGMNDHEYRKYEERIGLTYSEFSLRMVEAFKNAGARVILGSAGCVGKVPGWTRSQGNTVDDLNHNLCTLRAIDIGLAREEHVGFADVFWPMLTAGAAAQAKYGADYAMCGKDGVHPDWAGHTVMAYAFLKAMGLNGDIGTFTVDLKHNRMKASPGHKVLSAKNGEFEIRSSRFPFCACVPSADDKAGYPACENDNPEKDNSIRSAMTLIPFNQDLNRLMLVVKGNAAAYKVTWGEQTKEYTADQLAQGVNLAAEFPVNPFCAAFAKVDAAVAAKQAFETRQIKEIFHGKEGKENMEAAVRRTEAERAPLAEAVRASMVPVTHTIRIEAL